MTHSRESGTHGHPRSTPGNRKPKGPPGLKHKAAHNPRAAALLAFMQVSQGLDAQQAVDHVLRSHILIPSDRRLCTELVYGALRRQIRLRWLIQRLLKNPGKLPSEMLDTLLLALYELMFLRTPGHASVHEAVAHVRHRFGEGLSRVANGVLRTLQRNLDAVLSMDFYKEICADPVEAISLFYSAPQWLTRLWLEQYGEQDALRLLEASQEPAPTGLRLNALDPDCRVHEASLLDAAQKQEIQTLPVPPLGLAFFGSLPWPAKSLLQQGSAHTQSAASYEALMAMHPDTWKLPIWDACCGRGGKTLALLERGIHVALATDPSQSRINALEKSLLAYVENIPAVVCRASSLQNAFSTAENGEPAAPDAEAPREPSFATILVDAPCSGLGTLARRPEIRLRRTPEDLRQLVRLQADLLDAAWRHLLPGGSLVYITCTRNQDENEHQVAAFLARHPQGVLEKTFQTATDSLLREFFFAARIAKPAEKRAFSSSKDL